MWFYPCNRSKGLAKAELTVKENCTVRPQLPAGKFDVDSDNYFLFQDADGKPKSCYRILLRYIAFPPEFNMIKVNWL